MTNTIRCRARRLAIIDVRGTRRLSSSLTLVAAAALVSISGCAVNRATGERHLNLISESQEIAIGHQADSQIVSSIGLYPDETLQRYVQTLGARIAANSERPGLPWTFRVVDDPAVNAFAVPGGFIYVTRGLVTYLQNEAELAGVIGHEIGHVTAKHSVYSMSSQQVTQIGIGAGMILKPELQKYGQLLNVGLELVYLKYSRDDESQADRLGFRYMLRAENDPRQMIAVFDMLERVTEAGGGGRMPEWLETHPSPDHRSADFQKQIDTLQLDMNRLTVNRTSYLDLIDGMVFGEDPREGFFRANRFYHPELAFEFEFPSGWQTVNQRTAVGAISSSGDAVVQITMSRETSADQAATEFFGQPGMEPEPRQTGTFSGLPVVSAVFRAQTDQGVLQGKAAFVDYQGAVYQLLGYTTEQLWASYRSIIVNSIESFQRLTEISILEMQPLQLDIVTVTHAVTLDELAKQEGSQVNLETLAIINQTGPDASFQSGDRVKMVMGKLSGAE